MDNTHAWAKAGLMVRAGTGESAQFAGVYRTPGNGVVFEWRSRYRSAPQSVAIPVGDGPVWLKLVRRGNSFAEAIGGLGQALGTALNPMTQIRAQDMMAQMRQRQWEVEQAQRNDAANRNAGLVYYNANPYNEDEASRLVAWIVAQELRAQGEEVALLVLINCMPPNSSYDRASFSPTFCARFLKNLMYWGNYVLHLKRGHRREFLGWKLRAIRTKLLHLLRISRSAPFDFDIEDFVDLSSQPEGRRYSIST
jgi:hypothetical protein